MNETGVENSENKNVPSDGLNLNQWFPTWGEN